MAGPQRDQQREQHRINDRIRAREVRLIGPDGDQLGIKPVPDALRMARGLDLDLVEVAPMANPPVCRIMDYGKFRYEEAQKAKESRRKSTNVSVKEVKFRPKIGQGDFNVKVRKVDQFIHEGHKVKVTLQFRGREMAHPELGHRILDHVLDVVGPIVKVETQARLEGRSMSMVLSPDRKALDDAAKAATGEVPVTEAGAAAPTSEPAAADEALPDEAIAAAETVETVETVDAGDAAAAAETDEDELEADADAEATPTAAE